MILALDLGLSTGLALHDGGDVTWSATVTLPAAAPSRAYAALRIHVESFVGYPVGDQRRPDLVAYEAVPAQAHVGGDAAHRWGGFEAIVLAECERARVRYLGIRPAEWKRAAGLRSGTDAADALAAARRRWPGVKFGSADEAVARWIAVTAAGRTK